MLWDVVEMQCKVIPFNVMYVLSCFAMHWYVTLCKISLCMYACYVMLCHGILFFWHVMLFCVLLWNVTLC